ncbi:glycosyltransferase family 2 protein [Chryseobacterium hagamense]|uniref:N-acetylgalactosaminyl-diphosphoundecaprenol glucuronosyltransferase n=1 Tax=Chryseobacterium hagamense TaxID=395935 RepID=A0A511YIB5_9FLAO|nr:glycosyltransferase [Chryseobacterium hagamense]GEN74944.1 N-acetylgalactosaminyl-diphosphoundecaprenol glucuronosyltransferase [Chryseobacterium hagamense]
MKFSILIANYNNGKYFKECYDSVMAQEYRNWEAVILDDASTDDSVSIIKNIIKGDSRFRFFENPANSGVGITKSKLIELAEGDVCGFVDPDDAITPTAVSSSIKNFRKKVVLTYSVFMSCDENLKPLAPFKTRQVKNNDSFFFNYPIQIAHFVCFDRKIYLQTEKMNTTMRIAEDQDLYLKMYEKGKVKFINEVNYLYRLHSGGISQNDNKPQSYEYFAKVIFLAMKRRNLKKINGRIIPDEYTRSQDIYDLLEYQHSIPYRIKKKIGIFTQQIFGSW